MSSAWNFSEKKASRRNRLALKKEGITIIAVSARRIFEDIPKLNKVIQL